MSGRTTQQPRRFTSPEVAFRAARADGGISIEHAVAERAVLIIARQGIEVLTGGVNETFSPTVEVETAGKMWGYVVDATGAGGHEPAERFIFTLIWNHIRAGNLPEKIRVKAPHGQK